MNHSMINSMVTMHALQQKLDILSNNMANINTTGFKRKEATFEDVLTNMKSQPQGFQQAGRLSPLGFNQGWGAKLSQIQMNFSQGSLQSTGLQTDLAIEGDGLFEVATMTLDAQGNPVVSQNPVFTRDGAFELVVNPQQPDVVYLATKEGNLVRGVDNNFITIPKGHKFAVSESGQVSSYSGSVPEAGSELRGQIKVVRAMRPQFLQQVGENRYVIPAGVLPETVVQPVNGANQSEAAIAVRQGFLEQSNVNLADEMTDLMMVQKAFQLSSRALTSSDTMMGLATSLRP